jgi:dihydroxyacetone kinase-like protein
MKKFMNNPFEFVEEMLEGILLAYPKQLKIASNSRAIVRANSPKLGKVGIATGGGSGHLPVFMGYVGKGLADGASIGNVFSSPNSEQMLAVTKAIHGGEGVLYLFGNYQGDIMNFEMAREMAEVEGIEVRLALVSDDIASAPKNEFLKRRGVAGLFYAYKIVGAKAEQMANLEEVIRVAEKVIENTRTMGVALSPCTIPAVGKPTFSIGDDEMEIGMGIHGEPGIRRGKIEDADKITQFLMEQIISDLPFKKGDVISILVNNLGSTPKEELFIIYRKAHEILMDYKIDIYRPYVGEYATSLEMAGISITLIRLDEELTQLLDAPAESPFFVQT